MNFRMLVVNPRKNACRIRVAMRPRESSQECVMKTAANTEASEPVLRAEGGGLSVMYNTFTRGAGSSASMGLLG